MNNSTSDEDFWLIYFHCSTRSYDGSVDYGHNNNPLAHLSESVNSIDPLNAMEKSINEVIESVHVCYFAFGG